MRTLGLIGGMSWESSLEYYRILNQRVKERLGAPHSCQSLMYSVDFAPKEQLQRQQRWLELDDMMVGIARSLEAAGAEAIVICSNTMHRTAPAILEAVDLPLLHIGDAVAAHLRTQQCTNVGLLGTRFTMEQPFLIDHLAKLGLEVVVPDTEQREVVHRVIYEELIDGRFLDSSRQAFVEIIAELGSRGAQAVILGCTEIPLLVHAEDSPLPVVDTTRVHAEYAVDWALQDEEMMR